MELKGSDVSHAIEQIKSTIKLISDSPKKSKKYCFVVATRTPSRTTRDQMVEKQLNKQFNAKLRVKSIQDEFDLSKPLD